MRRRRVRLRVRGIVSFDIYTDGGCSGNPGPGAWAFVISRDEETTEGSGFERETTNNRRELTAVIRALETAAAIDGNITIHTDSQYVKNGITQWIKNWERNGWKTSSKEPVKNQELWMRLKSLSDSRVVDWKWLKGHAGHEQNERCDSLVQAEIRKQASQP